jgi:hypothetical protein
MKETDRITLLLLKWLIDRRTGYVITHYYLRSSYECDVMVLSESGYITEYEIKISKADFRNDFKKGHKKYWYDDKYNPQPKHFNKHNQIKEGNRTNKFYFVTPIGLLDKEEIPEHAGLIEVGKKYYNTKLIKRARWLHKRKVNDKIFKDLIDKFYHRYIFNCFYPQFEKINREIKNEI